jgi:hypothetical protein
VLNKEMNIAAHLELWFCGGGLIAAKTDFCSPFFPLVSTKSPRFSVLFFLLNRQNVTEIE